MFAFYSRCFRPTLRRREEIWIFSIKSNFGWPEMWNDFHEDSLSFLHFTRWCYFLWLFFGRRWAVTTPQKVGLCYMKIIFSLISRLVKERIQSQNAFHEIEHIFLAEGRIFQSCRCPLTTKTDAEKWATINFSEPVSVVNKNRQNWKILTSSQKKCAQLHEMNSEIVIPSFYWTNEGSDYKRTKSDFRMTKSRLFWGNCCSLPYQTALQGGWLKNYFVHLT